MTDSAHTARINRWLAIGLFVSVALNLFVAGLIMGGPFRDGPPDRRGPDMLPSPRMFIEAFGREDGRKVMRTLRDEIPDLRGKFRQAGEARRGVVAAMSADPYDPEALEAAFTAARAAHVELAESIQKPLTEVLADLTPEQRAKFADEFRRPRHDRRGGPDGERDGPPDGQGPPEE